MVAALPPNSCATSCESANKHRINTTETNRRVSKRPRRREAFAGLLVACVRCLQGLETKADVKYAG